MNDLFSLTPLDIKEHAVIERWRMNNRIRQEKQCSNGKNISIKIHYDALTNQINDKVKAKQLVEKLDFAYVRDEEKYADIFKLLDDRQHEDRRNLIRELNEFRQKYQQKIVRREKDLESSSIDEINQRSASLGSCLTFEGEDFFHHERQVCERQQMKQWLEEQCKEKLAIGKEREQLDQAFRNQQLIFAEHRQQLEERQINDRRQMENDLRLFNRTLADQKECQRHRKKIYEHEDKIVEFQNMLMNKPRTDGRSHRATRCIELL